MKKALLVGINYPKTQYALRGCINDILSVNQALVQHLGFDDPKLIRMLTDDSATTDNIIERLNWLVDGAKPGDVLFFGFSGHGSQIPATNYENNYELDGLDECICPIDMNWRDKMITDKTLKNIPIMFKSVNDNTPWGECQAFLNMVVGMFYRISSMGRSILDVGRIQNRVEFNSIVQPIDDRTYGN